MDRIQINSSNARGILFVLGPSLAFSINDLVFKLLSDAYPLHQMIFIRSVVALGLCAAIIVPLTGGRSALKTHRPLLHLVRGIFVVTSNVILYAGIAVGRHNSVFCSAPLMITFLSAFLPKEAVGVRRWGQ
jgi:drug/metabolite transporter (DMT)-like permease